MYLSPNSPILLQRLVTDILSLPEDNSARLKELAPIMVICSALCHFVDFDSHLFSEMKGWMKQICKQQSISKRFEACATFSGSFLLIF